MCTLKCKWYHKGENKSCLITSSFCVGTWNPRTEAEWISLGSALSRGKNRFGRREFLILHTYSELDVSFQYKPYPQNVVSHHKAKLDVNPRWFESQPSFFVKVYKPFFLNWNSDDEARLSFESVTRQVSELRVLSEWLEQPCTNVLRNQTSIQCLILHHPLGLSKWAFGKHLKNSLALPLF